MKIGQLVNDYLFPKNKLTEKTPDAGELSFRCNICGEANHTRIEKLDREIASCEKCGSTVRWRSIIHLLSVELFGESLALTEFPVRADIKGMGMSDWEGYAVPLAGKFDYQNTYFHQAPKLDITNIDPAQEGQFDFIISSDVFEHVPPPVSVAFQNVHQLLKPDGVLIFTVPYTKANETLEHFPELYDYQLLETDGRYTLQNVTKSGGVQIFEDLVFHGGPGSTLEMRVFSESSLIREFKQAGFSSINIDKSPHLAHGIWWNCDWSLPMVVSSKRDKGSSS